MRPIDTASSRHVFGLAVMVALLMLAASSRALLAHGGDDASVTGTVSAPTSVVTGGPLGTDTAYATTVYSGNASHLGKFEMVVDAVISIEYSGSSAGGLFVGYQSTFDATIVAANGDRIYWAGDGGFALDGSGWTSMVGSITGGTGRFEGAAGALFIASQPPHDSSENHPHRVGGSITSAGSGQP